MCSRKGSSLESIEDVLADIHLIMEKKSYLLDEVL